MKMQRALIVTLLTILTLHAAAGDEERQRREGDPPAEGEGRRDREAAEWRTRDRGDRAERSPRHGGPPPGSLMARMLANPRVSAELGLTDEQVSHMEDALAALREEGERLRRDMEHAAMEQARLMTAEEFDEAALMAAVERTGRVRTEIAKLRIRPLIILREILTPEQIRVVTEHVRGRRGDRPEGDKGSPEDRRERFERFQRRREEFRREREREWKRDGEEGRRRDGDRERAQPEAAGEV